MWGTTSELFVIAIKPPFPLKLPSIHDPLFNHMFKLFYVHKNPTFESSKKRNILNSYIINAFQDIVENNKCTSSIKDDYRLAKV